MMDPRHEQEIRKTVTLVHGLAHIECALDVAESLGDFRWLAKVIRREVTNTEQIAGDDLNASRRLMRGQF